MNPKIKTEAVDGLFDAVLKLNTREECYTFFEDLCTINEILSLKDKSEVIKILDDTINMHSDETVKENARSVKSLLALS